MNDFGSRKWVPHTCYRADEARHPQQWGIFEVHICDGCTARALQGQAHPRGDGEGDGDGAWTPENLARAIAELRTYGRYQRGIRSEQQDIDRVARVQRLLDDLDSVS